MSRSVEHRVTVGAPSYAVAAFIGDIRNWPKIWFSPVCPKPFYWEGEPWRVGSRIVGTGKVLGLGFRQVVEPMAPGEAYRVSQRVAGIAYATSCLIADTGESECRVTFATTIRGWASAFAPQSQLEAAPQFSMEALKTEAELAWLRGMSAHAPFAPVEQSSMAPASRSVAPGVTSYGAPASRDESGNAMAAANACAVGALLIGLVLVALSGGAFLVAWHIVANLH